MASLSRTGTPSSGTILRFAPSGPLPLNTTFEVSIAPGLRATDGGLMAESLTWTFTTGAPAATLSNQITFISDRGGVANVWAMNPDGSGQHEVSTELTPVLDYAIAPDASELVVADGRRLIAMRADGSERRVLTDEDHVEFDPSYAPDGQRLAFGRADAETGQGLGLWLVSVDGGEPTHVEPAGARCRSHPVPVGRRGKQPAAGTAVLPGRTGARLRRSLRHGSHPRAAIGAPHQRGGGGDRAADLVARLVGPSSSPHGPTGSTRLVAPDGRVHPMDPRPGTDVAVGILSRSGTTMTQTAVGAGTILVDVDRNGRLAYLVAGARLYLADGPDDRGDAVPATDDETVLGVRFRGGRGCDGHRRR